MGEAKRRAEAKAKGILPIVFTPMHLTQPDSTNRATRKSASVEVLSYTDKVIHDMTLLTRTEEENKPDKGKRNGSCNRRDCQKPGATWYNSGTRAYYCPDCAGKINDANAGKYLPYEFMHNQRAEPLCVDKSEDTGEEKFVCIRVCSNGEAKYTIRDKEGMESWVAYNKEARWGQALFVNGKLVEEARGYLKPEKIARLEEHLTLMLQEDIKKPIERMRVQPEYFGGKNLGTRLRYDDERYYTTLTWLLQEG